MKMGTPEELSNASTILSKAGLSVDAFNTARAAIVARAHWVLVNGKWLPRENLMRGTA